MPLDFSCSWFLGLIEVIMANPDFLGIQESRSRLDGYGSTAHYYILSASATQRGVGGIQLWVAKQYRFPHRDLRLVSQGLKILKPNAQRLVVRIEAKWIRNPGSCYRVWNFWMLQRIRSMRWNFDLRSQFSCGNYISWSSVLGDYVFRRAMVSQKKPTAINVSGSWHQSVFQWTCEFSGDYIYKLRSCIYP